MNQATVTRFPGVHRRADSGIYQFGLRAPQDLLAHFPGGWAIRTSLKTSDLKEANAKAKALHAPSGMLVLRPCAQANRAR